MPEVIRKPAPQSTSLISGTAASCRPPDEVWATRLLLPVKSA